MLGMVIHNASGYCVCTFCLKIKKKLPRPIIEDFFPSVISCLYGLQLYRIIALRDFHFVAQVLIEVVYTTLSP